MLVIVVNASDGNKEVVIDLPTPAEQTLATLKARCSSEFGIAENEMSLTFAGMSITAEAPLNSQMTDGATLTLQKVAKRKFFLHDIPPNANAETLLSLCDEHEGLLGQLMEVDTELGTALTSKDVPKVRLLLMKRMMSAHKGSFAKQQELNKLHSDPDNPENQRRMMELIQEEEIKKAHEMAMEENPESFAQVYMLYVNLAVQGVPIKAFVDSGAQMTIMSKECAEKVGILRLMDKRFAGLAVGVGSQKILGKVHMVQLQFGKSFFPAAITILEDASMDMIFGLDNLKRYRCAIDLKRNVRLPLSITVIVIAMIIDLTPLLSLLHLTTYSLPSHCFSLSHYDHAIL